MTVGDIARLHGVAQIAEGQNTNVVLDFTLPTGFRLHRRRHGDAGAGLAKR